MHTPIRFLGLESFVFLMSAIHIVDDQSDERETFDYISGERDFLTSMETTVIQVSVKYGAIVNPISL